MDVGNSANVEKLCHFMTLGCVDEFARHFEQQGWPDSSTPEMVQEWTRMRLVEGVGTVDATLHSMEGSFWDVYLQMRQSRIEQQTQRLYAAKLEKEGEKRVKLAAVEKNLRNELETKMTTYEARCSMQKDVQVLVAQVAELTLQMEQKDKKLLEAAHMVKKAREQQLMAEKNLRLHTRQQPSSSTTTGMPLPPSQS